MSVIYRNSTAYGQTMAYGGFTPVGTVISIMGNSAPANYLKCDGTIYNISDYPDLANYFVAQFGAANKFGGDGAATFAVPDLRGEFLRGTGTNSHTNQGNGANVGSHQDATEIPYMGVNQSAGDIWTQTTADANLGVSLGVVKQDHTNKGSQNVGRYWRQAGTFSGASGETTYTVKPTNTSVLYCIAVKNIYIENGGGGSGSNGHTIQDTDGNNMPNENNLQFIGLLVQDDSGNGVTTVEATGLNQESIDDVMSAGAAGNQVAGNGLVYSTAEQVIGRWVDGKPLYQKTWTGLTVTPAYNSWRNLVYLPDVETIVEVKTITVTSNYTINTSNSGLEFYNDAGYIQVEANMSTNLRQINIATVQYTKTTD